MSSLIVFLFAYACMVFMFLAVRRLALAHQLACDPSVVVRAQILQPKAKQANVHLTEKTRRSIL
jgi:hypothetical protein